MFAACELGAGIGQNQGLREISSARRSQLSVLWWRYVEGRSCRGFLALLVFCGCLCKGSGGLDEVLLVRCDLGREQSCGVFRWSCSELAGAVGMFSRCIDISTTRNESGTPEFYYMKKTS